MSEVCLSFQRFQNPNVTVVSDNIEVANMKRIQRFGGKFGKRSADEASVGTVIAEFKAMDAMLDKVRCAGAGMILYCD